MRKPEESTACRVRREEWHLWEIISRWLDCRVLHTTSFGLRREKVPRFRHGATESVEEKNDRVAQPMRKCGGVTRARAATQFAERLMPVELPWGGSSSYVRRNCKNEPFLLLRRRNPLRTLRSVAKQPFELRGGGLPRFSIQVKGESVVKGMSERIKRSQ